MNVTFKTNDAPDKKRNRGAATVEATLVMPLVIFAVLALFHMMRLRMAEAVLYEAATETVEYIAEFSYVSQGDAFIAKAKLREYLDNESLVDTYIGGVESVSLAGSDYLDDNNYVNLKVSYSVGIGVPLLGDLSGKRSYVIRQRAYKGIDVSETKEFTADDIYVYITDNKEAYHISRSCTHLKLSITNVTLSGAKNMGYSGCQFCGDKAKGMVYISRWGDRYHSARQCIGLKRTVYRVKKSQVEGMGACERCGYLD